MTTKPLDPPRRLRRTKDERDLLRAEILAVLEADHPQTVRQVFYQMVVRDVVPKDEKHGYKPVQRQLTSMRDDGTIPVDWIEDGSRRVRRPYSSHSMEEALRETALLYRRRLWVNQPVQVLVIVEKLALAGTLESVTEDWDVPLAPVQGFPSISLVYEVAQIINSAGKPAVVGYFGDWDPSGEKIPQAMEQRLRQYVRGPFDFQRLAINPEQIEQYGLPTRPTKRTSAMGGVNNHALNFEGDSVELDALPAAVLRGMVERFIDCYVDQQALIGLREAENSERDLLRRMSRKSGADFVSWLEVAE